ncbi:VWA domain-containing protein [uncultured Methanomethylovorans sp.]|uniref:VWA domain-containing protein n=1 Tax=uncultured Methanomethylovorans sp. TaxID=183759 RepID=UPI002AA7B7B7|nr:VWA domain-containing protein [uncultured Methanomethylovorans sp.]
MRVQTKFMVLLLVLISLSMSVMAVAVLVPPPSSIEMYPSQVQNSAGNNVSVMVRVTGHSIPLNNILVNFGTNLGYLNSNSAVTNSSGYARVFLKTIESGLATVTATTGSISNNTNITFSPLRPVSISMVESENPVTAGNVFNVTADMLDQFGNINETAELTLNITFEDVFGNTIHEIRIRNAPYTLTHIKANSTHVDITNTTNADPDVLLEINSTVAGNIHISASCGEITSTKGIEVEPGTPFRMFTTYTDQYTVNTTSAITVFIYDFYNNPISNASVIFTATPPDSTPYNSPHEYNSLRLSDLTSVTGIDGIASTVFRTDKRAGVNTVNITVANSSLVNEIRITGLADVVDGLFLTRSPTFAYANNQDIYSLTGQAVDDFLNPIIPEVSPITEQIVFYSGSSSAILPLSEEGKATIKIGPTPYVENVNITATYRNSSGYTNIANSTTLEFIAGDLSNLDIYTTPNTLLAQGLNGTHESTIKVVALDQWGHTLPEINLAVSTTNATVGHFMMENINATSINATTNSFGKATLKFVCSEVPGNTTIVASAGNVNASALVEVKDVPFLNAYIDVEPESRLKSGQAVNVTTVVSFEGNLPVIRQASNAMLVLDRSGSMDPDYYAGAPLDVVLVIDRSGSMDGNAMLAAKTASKKFATNLVSNSQLGVVSFAYLPFLPSNIDLELTPLNSSENLLLVNSSIDKLHAVGGTAMGNGMADANSMLIKKGRSDSRKVMILLTDGLTNQGVDQQGTAAVDLAKTNGITIYTIGLGNEIDESLLRTIASDTGGKYYAAPSSSDLASIYNAIAQEICDYDITDIEYGFEGFTPYSYNFKDSISIEDRYILSFEGYDFDDVFDASPFYGGTSAGECLIKVNGENFRLVPSVSTPANSGQWKTYQYDITNYIHSGANSISFYDYYDYTGSRDYYDYYRDYEPNPNPPYIGNNRIRNVIISGIGSQIASYSAETSLNENGYVLSFNKPLSSDYFEDTFEINESINDLKVKLQWEHSYANLDLQLISPSGKAYGVGYDTTGYYPGTDGKSEYIWISPLSNLYPDSDTDTVESGSWTVRVTGMGVNDVGIWQEDFSIATYIDKKSATQLSSHVFMSNFNESAGDKAGLVLYSNEGVSLTDTQTTYILSNSTWVGYFTPETAALYDLTISWEDSSDMEVKLYDGIDILSSSSGTGKCSVSSLLSAGKIYHLEVTKAGTDLSDTQFTVQVSSSQTDSILTAYSESGVLKSRFRLWDKDKSQWSDEKSAKSVTGNPYYTVMEPNPMRSEVMMLTGTSQGYVEAQVWNGAWGSSATTLSKMLTSSAKRGFDVQYEQISGDAVAVYIDGSVNSMIPRYMVWDGSAWSSAAYVSGTGNGAINWVKLAADPNSDKMVLATQDRGGVIRAQLWDGSKWGNSIEITKAATSSNGYQCFDVVYDNSGRAIVVYADWKISQQYVYNTFKYTCNVNLKSYIWDGTSWSSKSIGSFTPYSQSTTNTYDCWITAAADPTSNEIMAAHQDAYGIRVGIWNGASWSSYSVPTTVKYPTVRTVDVGYDSISGNGMVIWGTSSNYPKYCIWNGVSWSNTASASNIGSYPKWVQLTPNPTSSEMFLVTSDDASDVNIQKWSGSLWGAASEVETATYMDSECFDIAFSMQDDSFQNTPVLWNEWTSSVVSSFDHNSLSHLENSIDTITADGMTAIDEGLFAANNELSLVTGNSTVVLLTDGIDNAGYHSLLEQAYRAKENNTVIYTVGFGNSKSEVDPILADIASITGGEYYFAPNSSVLKNIFKGIAEQITNLSAEGPVMNIQIPHNYDLNGIKATVTFINGSTNNTNGNLSYFIIPTSPGIGNEEPTITTLSDRSILTWQLPNLNSGEKWGMWYQMNVQGQNSVPIILSGSNITYMNEYLNSKNVTVDLPTVRGDVYADSTLSIISHLGSLTMSADKSILLINEPTELTLEVKDDTGKPANAIVTLYSDLGYFNDHKNPITIPVNGSNSVTFTTTTAGNAYIIADAYNANDITDKEDSEETLVVRPKGKISIS